MNDIYLVDGVFLVTRSIRSLPDYHGARWSAWLRHACRQFGCQLDSLARGFVPLRSGQAPLRAGEVVCLRLLTENPGQFGVLGNALAQGEPHGEFSRLTLRLLFWQDAISGKRHPPEEAPCGLEPLTLKHLREETTLLAGLDSFSLHFHTPLRLKLPSGCRGEGRERDDYCQPEFFRSARAIGYLASKIRFWQFADRDEVESLPVAGEGNLRWHDLRYNQERRIALGGVAGAIRCNGRIGARLAEKLVLGQYLGAGKNPLFGLGYWQIPELAEARKIFLEQCAPSSTDWR
ncbi:MAG: hypothetical protein HDQ91_04275 [Desulfovibrio sp.]|nr:hypothetical protein [Desulfovibrio sp.]